MINNINKIIKQGEMKNVKNRVISKTEQKWDCDTSSLCHSLFQTHGQTAVQVSVFNCGTDLSIFHKCSIDKLQ